MSECPYCGFSPLPSNTAECPRCHTVLNSAASAAGTRLESVEDIRRWAEQGGTTLRQDVKRLASGPTSPVDTALPFFPLHRPPLVLLCILDDGGEGGEWIRVRGDEVVVGREEGDVIIPHDAAISARHFRLYRTADSGCWAWRLQDLGSTNGTFARVGAALLRQQQEILIGRRRLCFQGPAVEAESASPQRNATRGWQVIKPSDLAGAVSSLVELVPDGEGHRFPLKPNDNWIGSDEARASIVLGDDPFVSGRHASISKDERGRWHIRDAKSKNGTWLRIQEIGIQSTGEFQAGEQRFVVKVLTRDNPASGQALPQ
jgi:pSer/pThr/pTyr-binding forkhead associated (FHA) protein